MIVRTEAGTSESAMKKCKGEPSDLRHERASSVLVTSAVIVGSAFFAASLFGCPPRDPGFDLIRVPETAYLTLDGGLKEGGGDGGDGGKSDGGAALAQCFPVPEEGDFEADDDFPDCPASHDGDAIDPQGTQRHRDKSEALCCYRHGRKVRSRGAPTIEE